MARYKTIIKQFAAQGEKTGWTYIEVPSNITAKLKPGNKKSFRVKGYLDDFYFEGKALLPMGDGNFILALKRDIQKAIRKRRGAELVVKIEADDKPVPLNADFVKCLADEPEATSFFNSLAPGHQRYFSNWIESAKAEATKATRIAQAITAMARKQDFGTMVREIKKDRKELFG